MKRLFLLLVVGLGFFSKASESLAKKRKVGDPLAEELAFDVEGVAVDLNIVNSVERFRQKCEQFPAAAFIDLIRTAPNQTVSKDMKRLIAQTTFANSAVFRFLKRRSTPPYSCLEGHTDKVYSAVLNVAGDKVVTASADGTARIWSVATGMCEQVLQGHTDEVYSAVFNVAGDKVVTASGDGTARIWSVATGECEQVLQGHTRFLYSASFNEAGDKVVTASDAGTPCIWSVATGECEQVLEGHTNVVGSAVFNVAGDKVVTASGDGTARIWSVATGDCEQVLQGHTGKVESAVFNGAGNKVVTASDDETARIWSVATGACEQVLWGHDYPVYSASFNGAGDKVVTYSEEEAARIWLVATGECEQFFNAAYSASFNGAGDKVVAPSDDGARIWSAVTGDCEQVLWGQGHTEEVMIASFNGAGDKVVTASYDGTARIWDIDFLERFKRDIILEQAFLLNALYEVVMLRRLITLRERNGGVVTDQEGKVLTKEDVLFDFEQYAPLGVVFKEALVQVYVDLPQEIRAVFEPCVKPVEVIGQEAL